MKRILIVRAVAALMLAMMVAMAAPAFAQGQSFNKNLTQACREFVQAGGASPQQASFSCTPSRGSASLP